MNTQEIIDTTKQLIALKSTADNPEALRQAVEIVAEIVRTRCKDVTIEWFERNGKPSFLAYRGTERPAKFDILLNGHVDVVPGAPDQFVPVEKDGRLYGRGALDMKATTMALTSAFCDMVNEVPYELGLQIVSDEEIGGYDCVALQIEQGVRTDLALVGEYANHPGAIYYRARGLCWVELGFKGTSAHGGHLWHGSNAIMKASDFAQAILSRYPTPAEETWGTTANISSITTGNAAYNRVPDEAMLRIDFRFTPEETAFTNRDTLLTFIKEIDPEADLVDVPVFEPAVGIDENDPRLRTLMGALTETRGEPAQLLSRPAGTDGRHYALQGAAVIEFGVYGMGPHSDHEYIELSSIETYLTTIKQFLANVTPHTGNTQVQQIPKSDAQPLTPSRRTPHRDEALLGHQ
jgi:succinyl-diaminopimelate desuccinylase